MRAKVFGVLAAGLLAVVLPNQQSALGQRGGVPARPTPRPVASTSVARGAAVSGPFGSSSSVSTRGTAVGPAGGSVNRGTTTRTVTTPGGTTIRTGTAGVGGTGPGGVTGGRAVGGVQVTGPGGSQVTRVGGARGVSMPGGPTVVSGGRSAVATGPNGVVAGASRGAAVIGPGGSIVAGASRGGVAVGPRSTVGRSSTVHMGITTLPAYGNQVRAGFVHRTAFTPAWYRAHPAAWFTAGWATARVWAVPQYSTLSTFVGLPPQPVYLDYGTNVVYNESIVYVDGEKLATEEEYFDQALKIAEAGRLAKVNEKEEWQSLGVYALLRGDEQTADKLFQLAINRSGVIRGTYFDAFMDTTLPVYGQVDKKTQRAAWTVGEKKSVVYEVGVANFTRDETPVLVHFGKDNTQQFVLVHLTQTEEPISP